MTVTLAAVADTFKNLVTGLMTAGRDKSTGVQFHFAPMSHAELMNAYRGDHLAGKIVDIPANDMTRAWRSWQAEDPQIAALEAEEKRLGVREKVWQAIVLARLTGGAAILLGDGAPDPSKPLDVERIGKGGLKYLAVFHRYQLTAGPIDLDPASVYFNQPKHYTLNSTDQLGTVAPEIHPSRMVRFVGRWVPHDVTQNADGWGDSVLERVRQALVNAGVTFQTVAGLVQEAKVDVIQVKGLLNQISTPGFAEKLQQKWMLANSLKSTINALLLDDSEKLETRQISFANLHDVMDRFMIEVSAAAEISATKLWGRSPAGMNATGEGDAQNDDDMVSAQQSSWLDPKIAILDAALIRSALGGAPATVYATWNPLRRETKAQKAERLKKRAETTQIIQTMRLLPEAALAKAMRNELIEDEAYPGLEAALDEADAAGEVAGFEEPPPVEADPRLLAANQNAPSGTPGPREVGGRRALARDAAPGPRTLFVSRRVLNADAIRQWARGQGLKTMLGPEDLHVTVACSRLPVDWADMPQADGQGITVEGDRWRYVARLGDDGALVLMMESEALRDRWQSFIDAGASWPFEGYRPHVTLTYQAGYVEDPWMVQPYMGQVILGPEEFQEVVSGGAAVGEVSTEEDPAG